MLDSAGRWSLSTEHGASLTADELVSTLAAQHERMLTTWHSLPAAQWGAASRNRGWTVHETARHVADVMEAMTAQTCGEPWPFAHVEFDPNSTPELWLTQSADDPPVRTIERFAATAPRFRDRVGERVAAGDNGTAGTPYGSAHWTMSIVHTFWDTWLHDRDIAMPLGIDATSTASEQRLAGLYGLLMAVVPARISERALQATVHLTGPVEVAAVATHVNGTITSTETGPSDGALTGDLCSVVDALSGRGANLHDVLPGAPDLLAALGTFLSS